MFGMNVKDPLFPSTSKPLNDSVSSSQTSTATLALRTSGQLFAAHIAHRAAVDTTGAATTSSTSSATEATSGSNFSQEQTDAIVSAIMETSSSPSPHLWSFAQFLYISFALSATTIILPIIAGPIFRVTLRSFYQYKVYWRLAVLVFVLSSNIVLDVYIPPLPFEVVFGAPQVAFSLYKLAQARLRGRQKKRWTGYATLLGVCIAIDETAPGSFGTKKLIHYSQNVGLVAFLPPLYLFAIWMQRDPPMLSNSRLLSWKARLPFMKLSWRQKARPHKSRHLRICLRIFTVCVITGLNAMLSIFLPGVTYAIATSIPFGLFALDKLLPPMGKRMNLRGILQWYIFLTVVATSAVFQAIGFADLIGISALLPSVYLWMLYYGQDQIKAWFFQRGRGLNGSQLPSQMSD
ncbi:hypothetical protein OIDMADRAFT_177664 [Oidiodendron maius Zn]|uniref:Uncharacterized protein n=1 Tax=Oidiodendron maius (strain Zn) TaxID=913774 RepID=A0A0C3CWS6_OIDMZ|nr:hypothetical protein OIDMADRAFT_177664 [Oidiodendron maius Zn]